MNSRLTVLEPSGFLKIACNDDAAFVFASIHAPSRMRQWERCCRSPQVVAVELRPVGLGLQLPVGAGQRHGFCTVQEPACVREKAAFSRLDGRQLVVLSIYPEVGQDDGVMVACTGVIRAVRQMKYHRGRRDLLWYSGRAGGGSLLVIGEPAGFLAVPVRVGTEMIAAGTLGVIGADSGHGDCLDSFLLFVIFVRFPPILGNA